ncbi:unnamed protein product, partial [Meganyctiphanes norvegica]
MVQMSATKKILSLNGIQDVDANPGTSVMGTSSTNTSATQGASGRQHDVEKVNKKEKDIEPDHTSDSVDSGNVNISAVLASVILGEEDTVVNEEEGIFSGVKGPSVSTNQSDVKKCTCGKSKGVDSVIRSLWYDTALSVGINVPDSSKYKNPITSKIFKNVPEFGDSKSRPKSPPGPLRVHRGGYKSPPRTPKLSRENTPESQTSNKDLNPKPTITVSPFPDSNERGGTRVVLGIRVPEPEEVPSESCHVPPEERILLRSKSLPPESYRWLCSEEDGDISKTQREHSHPASGRSFDVLTAQTSLSTEPKAMSDLLPTDVK